MSTHKKIMILILLALLKSCQGQTSSYKCNSEVSLIDNEEYDYENINTEWLKKSIIYYERLEDLCSKVPDSIESLISVDDVRKISLGNEYYVKKGAFGKGYVGVFYTFIFKRDKLISFRLDMPIEDILLLEKYGYTPRSLFSKTLNKSMNNSEEYIFIYNHKKTMIPLGGIKQRHDLSKEMSSYMSPFSGLTYGCRGGYGNLVLENRCAFLNLIYNQDLTSDDLIYIMHSINLASRLTAIEYYTRSIDDFSKEEQRQIEDVISKIFEEFGDEKIEILQYDMGFQGTIEEAVNLQLKEECF